MSRKNNQHYLSNKEFYKEICKCQKEGKCSDQLAKYFMVLAIKIANKKNFSGYTFKDELISASIEACIKTWQKFDPEKSDNPFSYYTTVITNKILNIIKKFKRDYQREQEYKEKVYIELLQKNDIYVDMKKIVDSKGHDFYNSEEDEFVKKDKKELIKEIKKDIKEIEKLKESKI